MTTRRLLTGYGFVPDMELFVDPTQRGQVMKVMREYGHVVEQLDLDGPAGWVLLRRALQGGSSL